MSDVGDKMIEVVGLENAIHSGLVAGGIRSSGPRLAQCSSVVIRTRKRFPMQIDGEPVLMRPSRIVIDHRSQAKMLMRNKTATCKSGACSCSCACGKGGKTMKEEMEKKERKKKRKKGGKEDDEGAGQQ